MLKFLKARYIVIFLLVSVLGYYFSNLNFFTLTTIKLVITSTSQPSLYTIDKSTKAYTVIQPTVASTDKPNTYTYIIGKIELPSRYLSTENIAIKTNINDLTEVNLYTAKSKFIDSYTTSQFLKKWSLNEDGYYVCPKHILRNLKSPFLSKILYSPFYFFGAMLIFYVFAASLIIPTIYLKKQKEVVELYSYCKNYLMANKKSLFNYFTTTYLLITICFIGIAWTNYQYTDDATRFANSNPGWVQDGRILAHVIYQFFTSNLNLSIYNATPYTYFLSAIFLSVACVSLALAYNKKNIYISLAISSLLAIAPFYYEDILFRHDMLIMAFSLAYVVITALISQKLKPLNAFILQSLALFILYFMYQPMLLFYIVLMSFFLCYNLIVNSKNKDNISYTFWHAISSLASLVFTMIVFKFFSKFFLTTMKTNYSKSTSNIDIKLDLNYLVKRFNEVITTFFADWNNTAFGYLFACLLVLFLVVICYSFYKTKPKILSIALFKIALVSMFVSHSLLFLLNNISFIRRFFASTNLLLVLPLLYLYNQSKNKYLKNSAILLTIFILLNNFSMASYLSSSLQKQSQHEAQIKTILEEDIYAYKLKYGTNKNISYANTKNILNFYEDPSKKPALPAINNLAGQNFNFKVNIMRGTVNSTPYQLQQFKNQPYTVVARRKYYDFYYYPSQDKAVVYFKNFTLY